jgi:hypothetical protein
MSTQAESGTLRNPDSRTSAPRISLPKGGGAIRGIGEKFAANPVTGTGALTVPLAVSPGALGLRAPSLPVVRLRGGERPVRVRLEPFPPLHHPQDRQRASRVPRRRVGRLRPLRRGGPSTTVGLQTFALESRSFGSETCSKLHEPKLPLRVRRAVSVIERKHAKCDCSTSAGAARRRQPLPRRHHGHRVRDPPVPPAHRGAVQPHRALD